jgi:hypothetical protein
MRLGHALLDRVKRVRKRVAEQPRSTLAVALGSRGLVVAMLLYVLWPLLAHPSLYAGWDWEPINTHRELVAKTIDDFHQFPFWNPYSCGGHPAWGGLEGDTVVAMPWLFAYLGLPLAYAVRCEITMLAVWGAIGTWYFVGRFSRSSVVRAFAVVVFAVNGRWAIQLAAGHIWHLVYAWVPWTLLCIDYAFEQGPNAARARLRGCLLTGACLAAMVYGGGIYPLPQVAIMLFVYAAVISVVRRSPRPLVTLAIAGGFGIGMSAPKLLPMLDVLHRYPRTIISQEYFNLDQFVALLTNRDQHFTSTHAGIPWHSWHEAGMYLGWLSIIIFVAGLICARGHRALTFGILGCLIVVLAAGSFSQYAPWPLLHHLPVMSSQHVPSRWLFPGLLLLVCGAAAGLERLLVRAGNKRRSIELVGLVVVAIAVIDIGSVARLPLIDMFQLQGPSVEDSTGPFTTFVFLPRQLAYNPAPTQPATLPAAIANIGLIQCNTFHGLVNYPGAQVTDPSMLGRPKELGAHGVEELAYRGEVYLAHGNGSASFTEWSPNEFEVTVTGADVGDEVVVNQNWDPGWKVDGEPAVNYEHTIAAPVTSSQQVFHFVYRAPLFLLGCAIMLATALAAGFVIWRRRRSSTPDDKAGGAGGVTADSDEAEQARGASP